MQLLKRILPIVASFLYVISPVDVLPDFLLPGVGWLDDLLVVGFLLWWLSRQPQGRSPWDVFRERTQGRGHRRRARAAEDLTADFGKMDPYTLLEVSPRATPEEIKTAYKRAVARYHPDKVAHLGKEFQELAHNKLLAIQQAYESLQGTRR